MTSGWVVGGQEAEPQPLPLPLPTRRSTTGAPLSSVSAITGDPRDKWKRLDFNRRMSSRERFFFSRRKWACTRRRNLAALPNGRRSSRSRSRSRSSVAWGSDRSPHVSLVLFEGGSAGYTDTLKQYQAKAEFFLCACLQKNNGHNIKMTPGGLLYVDDWNNMQYVSSSTFLLTVYADYLAVSHGTLKCPDGEVKPSEILRFARSQVDYILGKNPKSMSYMVGYGSSFPTHVHHRGASIPSIYAMNSAVGCMDGFDKYYNSKGVDPNVLHGALVGGPDGNDAFVDDRCNYQHAEPTLAGNAPICGVFARLAAEPTDASDNSPAYAPPQDYSPSKGGSPLEFVHSVSNSWNTNGVDYYRHVVTAKNTCGHPITYLKLHIKELSGPIYGVSGTQQKDMYELPSWLARLEAGDQFIVVYIQGGPAAKISVVNYKTT